MRTGLRVGLRVAALAPFLALVWVLNVLGAAVAGAVDRLTRTPGRQERWRVRMLGVGARGLSRVLGMQVDVRGVPPRPPFILVTNHLSYVDVILIGSQLPCVFVAKAEIAGWPIFGMLSRVGGTLFIDRRTKRDIPRVLEGMERILASGAGVAIFPEGTSSRGEAVMRFRPSLLEPAVRVDRPVHYAALSYSTPADGPPADTTICWWGDMPFTGHFLKLLRVPRFRASLTFGEEPIRASDRKILATRLQQAVQKRFRAVDGSKETR